MSKLFASSVSDHNILTLWYILKKIFKTKLTAYLFVDIFERFHSPYIPVRRWQWSIFKKSFCWALMSQTWKVSSTYRRYPPDISPLRLWAAEVPFWCLLIGWAYIFSDWNNMNESGHEKCFRNPQKSSLFHKCHVMHKCTQGNLQTNPTDFSNKGLDEWGGTFLECLWIIFVE